VLDLIPKFSAKFFPYGFGVFQDVMQQRGLDKQIGILIFDLIQVVDNLNSHQEDMRQIWNLRPRDWLDIMRLSGEAQRFLELIG